MFNLLSFEVSEWLDDEYVNGRQFRTYERGDSICLVQTREAGIDANRDGFVGTMSSVVKLSNEEGVILNVISNERKISAIVTGPGSQEISHCFLDRDKDGEIDFVILRNANLENIEAFTLIRGLLEPVSSKLLKKMNDQELAREANGEIKALISERQNK